MNKPPLSWQGIGISSNPHQARDPLSLHLLAALYEASTYSDSHTIVVANTPQVSNYVALYGLDQKEAGKIAQRKGQQRQKDLQRICKANGLSNIEIMLFDGAKEGHEDIFERTFELYKTDATLRNQILSTVPQRLKRKTSQIDVLAQYSLNEIALILSFPGIKIGHEREKNYDNLALEIHQQYGVGIAPEFYYSKVGLESVPRTSMQIEPYSSLVAPTRLLLTDSARTFARKLTSLPTLTYEQLTEELKVMWGENARDNLGDFYRHIVKPSFDSLTRPARLVWASILGTSAAAALAGTMWYIYTDAQHIKEQQINQLSAFAFNGDVATCHNAVREKIEQANQIIQEKYFISNYFDS